MSCFLYNITSRAGLCKATCPLWQFPHCRSAFANTLYQSMTLFHWRNAHFSNTCQIPQNSYKLSVHGGDSNKLCRCTGMDQNTQDKKKPKSQMRHKIFTGTATNVWLYEMMANSVIINKHRTETMEYLQLVSSFDVVYLLLCLLLQKTIHNFSIGSRDCSHQTANCSDGWLWLWLLWFDWWAVFGPSRYLSLVGTFTWSSHLILWMSARFLED